MQLIRKMCASSISRVYIILMYTISTTCCLAQDHSKEDLIRFIQSNEYMFWNQVSLFYPWKEDGIHQYIVEPTGPIEDDPDLTDKKFPGNPSMSYRSTAPFRVVGEVTVWQSHPPTQVQAMKDALEKLKAQGVDSLNDV